MTISSNHNTVPAPFEPVIRHGDSSSELIFPVLLALSLVFFLCTGWHFRNTKPLPEAVPEKTSAITAKFIIEERKPPVKTSIVKKEISPEVPVSKPVDLTNNPVPAQKMNDITQTDPDPAQKPVRRVYGLKKVYSTGIGASGSVADAIIGKLGNTLNAPIDTITATESDIRGTPVSITTVTSYPRLKTTVKPEYTKEMIENHIAGVVRVKILIDIDGRVKQVLVLDDLGYGSKMKVAEACFKMVFEPAMIAETPASTWIMMRIRFELLNT